MAHKSFRSQKHYKPFNLTSSLSKSISERNDTSDKLDATLTSSIDTSKFDK